MMVGVGKQQTFPTERISDTTFHEANQPYTTKKEIQTQKMQGAGTIPSIYTITMTHKTRQLQNSSWIFLPHRTHVIQPWNKKERTPANYKPSVALTSMQCHDVYTT